MRSYTVFSKMPASSRDGMWKESFPSGNVITGIGVFGGTENETIYINRGDLWAGIRSGALPDVSETLARMRELAAQKRYKEASGMLCSALAEKGFSAEHGAPLPLAQLQIRMPQKHAFADYRRSIDLASGEVCVRWKDGAAGQTFSRSCFVSRADGVIVLRVRTNSTYPCFFELRSRDEKDGENPCPPFVRQNERRAVLHNYLYYCSRNDDGRYFGAVAGVFGGSVQPYEEGLCAGGAEELLVLVRTFACEESDACERCRAEIQAIPKDYTALFSRHKKLHGALFGSASVRLGKGRNKPNEQLLYEAYCGKPSAQLFEKMWAFGRYLYISGIAEGGLPFALYGLWSGEYSAVWAQNVLNENLQIIHSQAFRGNLAATLHPVFNYFNGMLPGYRECAKKLFGCSGIYIHAYSSPGMWQPCVNVPVITNWTGAAAWISKFYYDYWLYTRDEQFLRGQAMPFLADVCRFYQDFVYFDGDGNAVLYPSVSPENSPAEYAVGQKDALAHPMPTTVNATMDVALMREVSAHFSAGARICTEYAAQARSFEELVSRLPAYRIAEDGALSEWICTDFSDNNNHRHMVHIYPLYPGDGLPVEDPLAQACAVAVKNRIKDGFGCHAGWSLTHLANAFARLKEGERALECLSALVRSNVLPNFFTLANDFRGMGITMSVEHFAPIQLDANMGLVSAVQEMLLGYAGGRVELLPSLPSLFSEGSFRGLCWPNGRADVSWDARRGSLRAKLYYRGERPETAWPENFADAQIEYINLDD